MPLGDFRVNWRQPAPGMNIMLVRVAIFRPYRAYEAVAVEQLRQWLLGVAAGMSTPDEQVRLDFRVTVLDPPVVDGPEFAPGTPPREE